MNFEQNLFISYAHLDNEPLTPGEKGWVTRFHTMLKTMLSMRLGREAKIWRDEKLRGNDIFSDEIIAQFKKSAILVSIVTSRYLNSEWCTREAHGFCECAHETGGLAIGNRSRVFKIIKAPVDTHEPLPAPMKELRGYEFFTNKDGGALEYDPAYGQEYAHLFNRHITLLASELAELIRALDAGALSGGRDGMNAAGGPQGTSKPSVYLAECSYDQKQARDLLYGELKRLGYPILPDRQLPMDETEYVAAVKSMLERCVLSIHLVGENHVPVPNGPTAKSVGVHQNELAVARCKSGGLTRLIWLPQGRRSDHPAQQAFIEALHQDAQAQFGADLVAGEIEEFRTAIYATLKRIEQPEPKQPERDGADAPAAAAESGKLIYLICDEKDRKASVPLRKLCKQLGVDVELPAFEGGASHVRKTNQKLLANCDAILLYYGAGDEAWKRAIKNELKKMAGYRGGKPPPVQCTYLAEPKTSDKEDLIDMEEPDVIDGLAGFAEGAIAKFIRTMTGRGRATS
jgi:TIR domain